MCQYVVFLVLEGRDGGCLFGAPYRTSPDQVFVPSMLLTNGPRKAIKRVARS